QYCPVAHALGLVSRSSALLIDRELLQGPKRYTDLVAELPGIGTNILAARLKDLEACGVVAKHRLPPPAASQVYELTPYGLGLKSVMRELAVWGIRSLGAPREDEQLRRNERSGDQAESDPERRAEGVRQQGSRVRSSLPRQRGEGADAAVQAG